MTNYEDLIKSKQWAEIVTVNGSNGYMTKDYFGGTTVIPKYSDTRKIAVIILKNEQCGSSIG